MKAKMQKLETQASSIDIQSSIFKGVSVYVNGYTGRHCLYTLYAYHYVSLM